MTSELARTVGSTADARPVSVWLDRPEARCEVASHGLETATTRTDLLVIGGGLTGLWAAVEAAADGRDVVLVDRGAIGGGASGRCGGFINSSITHGIPHGHSRWPDEMPSIVRIQESLWDDTTKLLAEHGDDDVIVPCGKLTVATSEHQLADLDASAEVLRGYGQSVHRYDQDEVMARVASPTYVGGLHHANANGLCDPIRYGLALAGIAARRGARLIEGVDVERLSDDGDRVTVRCSGGATIAASHVLLATNAYRPLRANLRRRVMPVYDHVIATAPLDPAQWAALTWDGRCGITDAGNQFHYYRPTPDGRILFGGWDATYHFGGRVDDRLERRPETHRLLARHLVETFPQLAGIEITNAWGGPIDSTSRFTPMFGTAMAGKLGWAVGFTGLGVGASRFGSLAALDQLAGDETERTALTMVRKAPLPFPPEPLRWPIVQLTKRALERQDATGRRGPWLRLLDRVGVGFDT